MIAHQVGNWVVDEVLDPRTPQVLLCHHVATPELTCMVEVWPDTGPTREAHRRVIDALKRVNDGHVPDLIDFGIEHEVGALWRAFQVHRGDKLSDMLTGSPMDWRDVCAIFYQVAKGLEAVHMHGLAHRDIHPGRIVVTPGGGAWLTGFDYALTADDLALMAHAPVGNMAYLAPEVIADPGHHGPRADLYALGLVLYEALSGKPAFPAAAWGERADSATRMLEWKTRTAALDPSEHVDVPDWLCNLVRKATDPNPDKRLPDIEAFVGWLDAAMPAWISDPRQLTAEPAARRTKAPPQLSIPTVVPSISRPSPEAVDRAVTVVKQENPPLHPQVIRLLELAAMVLGVVTGMAFSSLIVVLVEMSMRAI